MIIEIKYANFVEFIFFNCRLLIAFMNFPSKNNHTYLQIVTPFLQFE